MKHSRPRRPDSQSEAQRLFMQGWRAYPICPGALARHDDARPSASVSQQIWAALRLVERDKGGAVTKPMHPDVAVTAEALLSEGWHPTRDWCRVAAPDGERPRLVDAEVWQAMRDILASSDSDVHRGG
jgi:hypothetical protein